MGVRWAERDNKCEFIKDVCTIVYILVYKMEKKELAEKKAYVWSQVRQICLRFLYLLQLQGMAPKLLSHGVFLFKFNKKDINLPVK